MTISVSPTAPPTAPNRSQPKDTFNANIEARLAWDETNVAELTQFINELNAMAPTINSASAPADTALAAANFKGDWSAQSGAMNKPASVRHNGSFWALLNNLPNVTTSQPGVSADWALLLSGCPTSARTSNSVLVSTDSGTFIVVTSGTFTQTVTAAASLGSRWFCQYSNMGTGIVTIDPNGAETINGASTLVLYPGETVEIFCDGSTFRAIYLSFTGDHQVVVHTGNGYGSTNTRIRRFTTALTNVGQAITYADSATLGASFTINHAGLYAIDYEDSTGSATEEIGISVNSAQLTTAIESINVANRLKMSSTSGGTGNDFMSCSTVVKLNAGDVVRPHVSTSNVNGVISTTRFSIRKISHV